MNVYTNSLEGNALDWAVMRALHPEKDERDINQLFCGGEWKPSTNWSIAGPIIEKYKRCAPTWNDLWLQWQCNHPRNGRFGILGPDYLITAMRWLVIYQFGDEMEIPDYLMK
jgi:hypothetical protein